ncbi:hypothetical protein GGI21_002556, partial [Coemansia aciculifera]
MTYTGRSPFQTLPMLLVHKIVEYIEGRPRMFFATDMDKHNKQKAVLTPLLAVSERWRSAALDSICDNCLLDYDHSRLAVEVTYPAWPVDFLYPRFRKNHLVKRVVVASSLWSDLTKGLLCEVINRPQYESMVFSSASSLVILLSESAMDKETRYHYSHSYSEQSSIN